jgi:transmembrane sensor
MKHQDYFLLIHKKLSGNITRQEEELLNQWLDQDQDNRETFDQLKLVWDDAGEDDLINDEYFAEQLLILQQKVKDSKEKEIAIHKAARTNRYMSIAIIALVVLCSGLFVGYLVQGKLNAPTYIAMDENRKVLLADNSSVLLNRKSSIVFSQSIQERKVELEGEAFFDVAKDKSRPFCIYAKGAIIRVIGTSFVVKSYQAEPTKVIVISGKVEVIRDNEKLTLYKGEKIVIVNPGDAFQRSKNDDPNFDSWYTHKLSFKKTPLEEIFSLLEDQYQVNFEVSNPEVLTCRFTGIFDHESLDKIVKILSYSLDFTYELNDGKYFIKGKGCNQKEN